MAFLNTFISMHIKSAEELFQKLALYNTSDNRIEMESLVVPDNIYDNSLMFIHKHLCMIYNKVEPQIKSKSEDFKQTVQDIVQEQ